MTSPRSEGDQPSFVTPPVRGMRAGELSGTVLRRRGSQSILRALSIVLAIAGIAVLAFPAGTDFYAGREQHDLGGKLTQTFTQPSLEESYQLRRVPVGNALTRLRIRAIGVNVVVVEGVTPAALRAGAGHYPGTPLPGEIGNVGIAGHRTTYGRPFNRLAELRAGDTAELETPFGYYTYKLVGGFDNHPNPWPVFPTTTSVLRGHDSDKLLTLTTCHPKGSARQRLIARFVLVSARAKPGKILPPDTGSLESTNGPEVIGGR